MNDSLLSLGLMIWVEKQCLNGQGLMKNEYECSWLGSSIVVEKIYHMTHGRNIYLVEDMDKISIEWCFN
jgi:hypothetical protein